jgi:hypothetical protein
MKRLLILCLCLLCGMAVFAQNAKSSHYLAAEKLLTVSISAESYATLIETSIDQQIDANPAIGPYRDIMLAYLTKYMSYDAIKEDLIQLYMKNFTEKELNEITAFYQTPTGKKAAKIMPDLFQQGAAIGQNKVQEHISELQEQIQAAATSSSEE